MCTCNKCNTIFQTPSVSVGASSVWLNLAPFTASELALVHRANMSSLFLYYILEKKRPHLWGGGWITAGKHAVQIQEEGDGRCLSGLCWSEGLDVRPGARITSWTGGGQRAKATLPLVSFPLNLCCPPPPPNTEPWAFIPCQPWTLSSLIIFSFFFLQQSSLEISELATGAWKPERIGSMWPGELSLAD